MKNTNEKTRNLCVMGMLCAVSVVLVYFIHISIIPTARFLEYDPADVPILLATYFFGPLSGLAVTLVVSLLQGLTVSASSGFIGIMMHFISTGTMAVIVGLIAKRGHFGKRTTIAAVCGALAMVLMMIPLNLIITPVFMGVPRAAVVELMLPAIIPFNLIKAGINSFAAFGIYGMVNKIFTKQRTIL